MKQERRSFNRKHSIAPQYPRLISLLSTIALHLSEFTPRTPESSTELPYLKWLLEEFCVNIPSMDAGIAGDHLSRLSQEAVEFATGTLGYACDAMRLSKRSNQFALNVFGRGLETFDSRLEPGEPALESFVNSLESFATLLESCATPSEASATPSKVSALSPEGIAIGTEIITIGLQSEQCASQEIALRLEMIRRASQAIALQLRRFALRLELNVLRLESIVLIYAPIILSISSCFLIGKGPPLAPRAPPVIMFR